ncbi:MAG TPA: guanylate kinase, partial [Elusimicrobiota bacterium]|nr:guanylate kinase [Elusimicrobiota bacterium]
MIRGLLLVVSAPSGAGKSTLCQALVQRRPDLTLSVSCTTRPPRPTEKNGVDYHFLSETDFEKRVTEG